MWHPLSALFGPNRESGSIYLRDPFWLLSKPRACRVGEERVEKVSQAVISQFLKLMSREQKKAVLYEKLQLLRSVTNSQALNKTLIIIDASKYTEELKQKVERLNEDLAVAQNPTDQNPLPMVTVETLDKGFLINVFSERSGAGLLVSILEAFEELGLEVIDASLSCEDSFHFEAVGENQEQVESMDAQVVKQAVLQAIKNCSGSSDQE